MEIIGGNRIAVANAGSEEVRIFDLDGRHVGSFGRAGRGPREFLRLRMVEDTGDSLLIYEAGNDRVSVRSTDDLGRIWARRYPGPDPSTRSWWLFDQGRVVAEFDAPPGFEIMDVERGLVAGVWRNEFDIEHVRVYRQTLLPDGE